MKAAGTQGRGPASRVTTANNAHMQVAGIVSPGLVSWWNTARADQRIPCTSPSTRPVAVRFRGLTGSRGPTHRPRAPRWSPGDTRASAGRAGLCAVAWGLLLQQRGPLGPPVPCLPSYRDSPGASPVGSGGRAQDPVQTPGRRSRSPPRVPSSQRPFGRDSPGPGSLSCGVGSSQTSGVRWSLPTEGTQPPAADAGRVTRTREPGRW